MHHILSIQLVKMDNTKKITFSFRNRCIKNGVNVPAISSDSLPEYMELNFSKMIFINSNEKTEVYCCLVCKRCLTENYSEMLKTHR